jgi:hypothetical protein
LSWLGEMDADGWYSLSRNPATCIRLTSEGSDIQRMLPGYYTYVLEEIPWDALDGGLDQDHLKKRDN